MHSILYIDDEPHSLNSFRLSFEDEFQVFTAANTSEGYQILKENDIQLVVTDQRMPVENGTDFLNRIRKDFPGTVRTILTGYSDIEAILDAINECHIYYYFKKPWKEEELKLAFRNAIEASNLTSENQKLIASLKRALVELERKSDQLEEQLRDREGLVQSLQRTSEAKSNFLSVMSHELRTPLNPIIGLSDMVSRVVEDSETRSHIELINRSGKDLLAMINSIMEFVQHGSLRNHEVCAPIDLSILIHDSVTLARTTLEEGQEVEIKGKVMLDGEITNDELVVMSHADALRQIVQNLVANACKFTDKGSIEISANLAPTSDGDTELKLSVKDTGIGIDKKDTDAIFEAFAQVDQSLSRNYYGLGLGLAICKQISESVHGKLSVESEPGKGSSFSFSLPIPREAQFSFPAHQRAETDSPLVGKSCLIIERDPHHLAYIKATIKRLGGSSKVGRNHQDAVDALRRQEFDLIIIDVSPSGRDNEAILSEVEAIRLDQRPIVVFVGNSPPSPGPNLQLLGVAAFLQKPLKLGELTQVLNASR
ncbi:ATP-binding protein [Pelagicoccus albus]|uniref:histidine kinase n=1 Tax=Pelagicoccus albus TaxID=415222 RepID=A0A7X1B667_9BACT|nr:ATP-binding protein [Pelagicoccus albus]MBC2606355.1 response regulator [Pelagicoccus albus]